MKTGSVKTRTHPPRFLLPMTPCNLTVNRCPVSREQASKRILIMRIGAFGDILMGTPLLAALRRAYPDAHLTWAAGDLERQAIDANPYIDELLVWEGGYWKRMIRSLNYPFWLARVLAFRRELRRRRYDVFISFQPEEWPLLTLGVGAPISVGIFDTFKRFHGKSRRPYLRRLYTHPFAEGDLPAHRTDQYLLTLKALGLPPAPDEPTSMGYTAEDAAFVGEFLRQRGIERDFAAIAPMTTWATRCWPRERFAALGDALAQRHGRQVILIGSAKERDALEEVAGRMERPPLVIAGDFSFRQMAALLARASLLVSSDTGPMHVASALGTPQVALFGPTSPSWYGPRSAQARILAHSVPCGPCDRKVCGNTGADYLRCMRLITVEEVLEAIEVMQGDFPLPLKLPLS